VRSSSLCCQTAPSTLAALDLTKVYAASRQTSRDNSPVRGHASRTLAVASSEPLTSSGGPRFSGQQLLTKLSCSAIFFTCTSAACLNTQSAAPRGHAVVHWLQGPNPHGKVWHASCVVFAGYRRWQTHQLHNRRTPTGTPQGFLALPPGQPDAPGRRWQRPTRARSCRATRTQCARRPSSSAAPAPRPCDLPGSRPP